MKKIKRDDGYNMESPVSVVMPSGSPQLYPKLPFTKEPHEPPEPEVRIGRDRFRVTVDGVIVYFDEFAHAWKVSIYQPAIIGPLYELWHEARRRAAVKRA